MSLEQYEDSKKLIFNNKYKRDEKRYNCIGIYINYKSIFAQAVFDKFDGQDDVTSIIVNKKMFELMSKVKVDASDKETQQYMNLIKKLELKVLLPAAQEQRMI
jgi:hypothetical protein